MFQVLQSPKFSEEKPASNVKKDLKKKNDSQASKRVSNVESYGSSYCKNDEEDE